MLCGITDSKYQKKYENFALNLLKQCIQYLADTHDPKKRAILLNLADQCCKALQVRASGNYEKLVLHLAKACITIDEVTLGISYCDMLAKSASEVEAESNGLLKYVFSIMGDAGRKLDEKGYPKDYVLVVRKRALQCLLRCQDFELISALKHVMKAESLFLGSTCLPTLPHQVAVLAEFHTDLIPTLAGMFYHPTSCDQLVTVARYLHRRVLVTRAESGIDILHGVYADVLKKHSDEWCHAKDASLKVSHRLSYTALSCTTLLTIPFSPIRTPCSFIYSLPMHFILFPYSLYPPLDLLPT